MFLLIGCGRAATLDSASKQRYRIEEPGDRFGCAGQCQRLLDDENYTLEG